MAQPAAWLRGPCPACRRACVLAYLTALAAMAWPAPIRAQGVEDPPTVPTHAIPAPLAVLVVEVTAFGSGAAARSETGARVVGAIQAASALAVVGVALFGDEETGPAHVLIPYGVGLLALSAYNLASASSDDRGSRFWTNVVGINVAVLASVLAGRAN